MKISENLHKTSSGILRGSELVKRKFDLICSEKSFENLSFVGETLENGKGTKINLIDRHVASFSHSSF